VASVDDRVRVDDQQAVTDRVDDRAEVGKGTPGRPRAAGEQRVTAEEPALAGYVEAPAPRECPGVYSTVSSVPDVTR